MKTGNFARIGVDLFAIIVLMAASLLSVSRADEADALSRLGRNLSESKVLDGSKAEQGARRVHATSAVASFAKGGRLGFAEDARERNQQTIEQIRERQTSVNDLRFKMSDRGWNVADQLGQRSKLADFRRRIIDHQRWNPEVIRPRINDRQWRLAEIRSRVSDQQWKLADLHSRVSDQQWRLGDMRSRMSDQQWKLADMRARMSQQQWRLADMRSRMNDQQWKLADMRSRMSQQHWKLADMRSRINDQQWRLADMRSRMSDQLQRQRVDAFTRLDSSRQHAEQTIRSMRGMALEAIKANFGGELLRRANRVAVEYELGGLAGKAGSRVLGLAGERYAAWAAERRAPVVIGETMGRVNRYARGVGGYTIDDWLAGKQWSQKLNDKFIATMKEQRREFIDIGPDFGGRLHNRIDSTLGRRPSATYGAERYQLLNYEKYQPVYERVGKYQGGVPGFDPKWGSRR